MELPVARHPGQKATPDALIRAIKRGEVILARMIAEEKYLDGATVFTSPQRAAVASANGAADLRLPPGTGASTVLDNIDAWFSGQGVTCQWLDAAETVWPAELAAAIERRGFRAVAGGVMALADYTPPAVDAALQVIPGRAAYRELRTIFEARSRAAAHADPTLCAAAMIDQLDESRVDVFLARRERRPVGVGILLTLGNIGIVLELFVAADDRRDPILRTLAARLLDHCQRAQFEQVIVRIDEGDPNLADFAALGFRTVTQYVRYVRENA
jgi:hypothetical protein